jgi:hypothetical protein
MSPIEKGIKSLERNARLPPQPCLGLFSRQELPDSTATETTFARISFNQQMFLLMLHSASISLRPTSLIKASTQAPLLRITGATQSP